VNFLDCNNFLLHSSFRLKHNFFSFLDDIERIAAPDYEPTDDDVIRARLRTIGVQEYYLEMDDKSKGNSVPVLDNPLTHANPGFDLCIIDVGGSRTRRAAWLPYFEDVNAVLFLAPISCFNETLAGLSTLSRNSTFANVNIHRG
jgi:guanine nucleotide-binding protein subunit alpha